jgi:hypothetical protein
MSNIEQEHPDIDIAFITTDEVLAWKRPIRLRFKGNNEADVSLLWDKQRGYSAIVDHFYEGWSEYKKQEFLLWLEDQANLRILDDLTSWNGVVEEDD